KSFYQETVVHELVALLRLIRNPHDDQAFIRVALSPAGNISDVVLADLATIAHNTDGQDPPIEHAAKRSLYDALDTCITRCKAGDAQGHERCECVNAMHFREALERAISQVGTSPISEIVTAFYRDRGVLEWWDRQGFTAERDKANFYKTMRMADSFAQDDVGLIDLIALFERAQDDKREDNIGQWLSEEDQRVKITTVHKAKGLQFPVVAYFAGDQKSIGKKGSFAFFDDQRPMMQQLIEETITTLDTGIQDAARTQWAHHMPTDTRSRGSIIYVTKTDGRDKKEDALYELLRRVLLRRDYDEAKRLFYVASTRAQDHLLVTYHASGEQASSTTQSLGHAITKICADTAESTTYDQIFVEIDQDLGEDECSDEAGERATSERTGSDELILRELKAPHRYEPAHQLVQISASQIQVFHQCPWRYWWTYGNRLSIDRDTVWKLDADDEVVTQTSVAHKGTVLHKLFEVVGERSPGTAEGVDRSQIRSIMTAYGVAVDEQEEIEDTLQTYLDSDLYREIATYPTIHHEYQFYTAVEAYYLFGYMDVFAIDEEGHALIVDYKISTSDVDKSLVYARQARLYAFVALAQGASAVRVVFAQVNADTVIIDEGGSFTQDDIETLRGEILDDIEDMQKIQTEQPIQPVGGLCRACAVPHSLCSHSLSS
ncbi:MAG: PD-(D/E)XK nuclease family protein, partial [Actinomycetia bacterium]|nr:PD-(D/E)XK nuclease family protein [Actinomycetes bacterium]